MQTTNSEKKPRGRPPKQSRKLDMVVILEQATLLIEAGGETFSMRELAQTLGVDPMALYHYVANKEALLQAVVHHWFGSLHTMSPPFSLQDPPLQRLIDLARCYLAIFGKVPVLTRLLAAGHADATAAEAPFRELFNQAVSGLALEDEPREALHAILVDYLFGASLAPEPAASQHLERAITWLVKGALR